MSQMVLLFMLPDVDQTALDETTASIFRSDVGSRHEPDEPLPLSGGIGPTALDSAHDPTQVGSSGASDDAGPRSWLDEGYGFDELFGEDTVSNQADLVTGPSGTSYGISRGRGTADAKFRG